MRSTADIARMRAKSAARDASAEALYRRPDNVARRAPLLLAMRQRYHACASQAAGSGLTRTPPSRVANASHCDERHMQAQR